jgi:prophage regulatory protein
MNTNQQSALRIIRIRAVREKTGRATSAIYAAMAKGMFPRPVPLGDRAVGWLEHEVDAWIEAQRAKRDATTAALIARLNAQTVTAA